MIFRSCCGKWNYKIEIIELFLSTKDLDLNIANSAGLTALKYLLINEKISKSEKKRLFKLFLNYKYCKLDLKIQKIESIIKNDFEYKELVYYHKSPEQKFYKFKTEEYYNINFLYLHHNQLKRKYF